VDIFSEARFVDVIGTSKGRGFAGVVRRHGFGGGPKSHVTCSRCRFDRRIQLSFARVPRAAYAGPHGAKQITVGICASVVSTLKRTDHGRGAFPDRVKAMW